MHVGVSAGPEETCSEMTDTDLCIYCGQPTDDGTDEHEACWQRSVGDAVSNAGESEPLPHLDFDAQRGTVGL